ncbi:MAG: TerC family protein [Actinomycetales bacterium]|nr:TerC family protein [Actinomycetales bacterium]
MVTTNVVLVCLVLFDLGLVIRRPHVPSMREATRWVAFYVGLAMAFAAFLFALGEQTASGQFVAGWLTEYSLSVDNLFVFVLIMSRFAVPRAYQQKVLKIGIIVSLVLRGGFIALGAAVIQTFSWVFYVFGAFLVYTAVQLARSGSTTEEEFKENVLIRRARRLLPMSTDYDGAKLRTRVDGRVLLTPMVIVFIAIGSTDLLFAVDSIPAIFGLTQDPFIVFTATVFALMGLRQLYFLLGGLLNRLVYLSYGLSVILGFIGVKMLFEALHMNRLPFLNGGEPVAWAPVIPVWLSLTVIVLTLAVTAVLSLAVGQARGGTYVNEKGELDPTVGVRHRDPDDEQAEREDHPAGEPTVRQRATVPGE